MLLVRVIVTRVGAAVTCRSHSLGVLAGTQVSWARLPLASKKMRQPQPHCVFPSAVVQAPLLGFLMMMMLPPCLMASERA